MMSFPRTMFAAAPPKAHAPNGGKHASPGYVPGGNGALTQAQQALYNAQIGYQKAGSWPRNQGAAAIRVWAAQMVGVANAAAQAAQIALPLLNGNFQAQQSAFSARQAASQVSYRATIAQNDADANQIQSLTSQAISYATSVVGKLGKFGPNVSSQATTKYTPVNGGYIQGPRKALGAATATTAADVANQVGVLTAVFANVTAGNALTPSQVTAANAAASAIQADVNQLGGTPDPSAVGNAGGVSKGMAAGAAVAGLVIGFAVAKLMR